MIAVRVRAGWAPSALLAVPLVLVNAVAVHGQWTWAMGNVADGHPLIAGVFAAALESIGVYLAYEAHRALLAGDASGKLRAGSYIVALLVGALNYDNHSGPGHSPTTQAVAYGALSAISPWLWAIRSRSIHRDELRAKGLIDPRAPKFSTARWLHFPGRTLGALRAGVWAGVTDPAAAIALRDQARAARPAEPNAERVWRPTRMEVRQVEPDPVPVEAVAASPVRSAPKPRPKPKPRGERPCPTFPRCDGTHMDPPTDQASLVADWEVACKEAPDPRAWTPDYSDAHWQTGRSRAALERWARQVRAGQED